MRGGLRSLAIGGDASGSANSIVTSFWRSIIRRIGKHRYKNEIVFQKKEYLTTQFVWTELFASVSNPAQLHSFVGTGI